MFVWLPTVADICREWIEEGPLLDNLSPVDNPSPVDSPCSPVENGEPRVN